jgi:putative membrane protein
MKINSFKQITCIAYILFAISCNNNGTADNERGDTTNVGRSGVQNRGEDFVTDVLEMNAEEKAWLREAMNSATDQELKSTARQMMEEHEKLDTDLRDYAAKRNFRTDDIDTSETVRLNERRGMDWDEEWADEVGDKHRQMIRRFERAEKRVEDADLKNLITQNLPTLRTHLGTIEKLEARLDKNDLNPNINVDPVVK